MGKRHEIRLTINGVDYRASVEPRLTLVDFLRGELGLTGTHVGCEHGVCGACTVLLDGASVRSCLMLAVQADGAELMTVEGLGEEGRLHPIQQAFMEEHGLQCGFCTPGFLLVVHELLQSNPDPSDEEIREALGGQICRCTGYQSILSSVRSAAHKLRQGGASGTSRESQATHGSRGAAGPEQGEIAGLEPGGKRTRRQASVVAAAGQAEGELPQDGADPAGTTARQQASAGGSVAQYRLERESKG